MSDGNIVETTVYDIRRTRPWWGRSTAVPNFHSHIEPGQRVRHPLQPGWGIGQVQSAIEDRITVNFPNAGKIVINARAVSLEIVEPAPRD